VSSFLDLVRTYLGAVLVVLLVRLSVTLLTKCDQLSERAQDTLACSVMEHISLKKLVNSLYFINEQRELKSLSNCYEYTLKVFVKALQ